MFTSLEAWFLVSLIRVRYADETHELMSKFYLEALGGWAATLFALRLNSFIVFPLTCCRHR